MKDIYRLDNARLLNILNRLVKCIKGKWFIGDGTLLGIIRDGKMLPVDMVKRTDIDLYFMPDTTIDYDMLQQEELCSEDYYLNEKIYDPSYQYIQQNPWREYLAAFRVLNREMNKAEIMYEASPFYQDLKIQNKHTTPNIDIYYLKEKDGNFVEDTWDIHFTKDEVDNLKQYELENIPVYIPNNPEQILERQYGPDWRIPDPFFKYL